jgi:L,D-transpeptidase YcbB
MVNDMKHHLFRDREFERWGLCAIWSSMNRPDLIRFCIPSLLGLAAAPALAQPPAVAPTLPSPAPPVVAPPAIVTPPPVQIPPPSAAQQAWLKEWLKGGTEQGLMARRKATRELGGEALISAVLDRAKALSTGRVDTADFLNIWALRPAAFDPRPGLARAIAEDRLPQWAAGLTPPYSGYEGLRRGLATYERIRDTGGWPALTAQSAPDAVRARLAIEDKSVQPGEKLSDALQRAQRRYGLNPTGLLDTRTLKELNVPVDDRIAAIMANMERWRWMPRQLPVNRVQVNIAAAVLTLFEGDQPVTSMRAVTGSPDNATPMLTSNIHSIVVNPPWNVPASIAKKELWPKGRAALIRQGYKIVGTPENGERIVQPAGPNSALGRLKFDFNNPFAVYLHDTPARAKFASYDRLASHGCIRLEKPVALAELMVQSDPKLAGQVQSLIDTGKTQRVQLPQEVAVYLLYWTAFASSNGTMNFRSDPYGWDKLLAQKIEASSSRMDPTVAPAPTVASKD